MDKPKGRPKKKNYDTTRGSFVISSDTHSKISRLVRHKGLSFNDFLCTILDDFVKKNSPILKILDETDERIAEIEKDGDSIE